MKIQLVSIVAPPDGVSTAQLVGEVAQDLSAMGHQVNILSTAPHYNTDTDAAGDQPITWSRFRMIGSSNREMVRVDHVRMSRKARSRAGRLFQWGIFHAVVAARLARTEADAILVVSPPPTLALLPRLRPRRKRPRVVLAVWELYPDILVSLGHLSSDGWALKLMRRAEASTYRACEHVAFLAEGMHRTAVSNHPFLAQRSSVVPTWADTETLAPVVRPTGLARKYGLDGCFVVGYGGNLGPAQDLRSLLRAAQLLEAEAPHIRFLICGGGTMAADLHEISAGSSNVTFTGQLGYAQVADMYSTFDLSIVPLADGVAAEALPSKLYRSLSCGVPVLAVAHEGSPLADLVSDLAVGRWSAPSDPEALAVAILEMANDPSLPEVSERARRTAVERFDRKHVTAMYARLLAEDMP